MFMNGPRSQSNAEYARSQVAREITAAAQYPRSEDWFDGSLDSVDRRLAVCDKLLHQARAVVGVEGLGNPTVIDRIASLEADRLGLGELRETMITGAAWRHSPAPPDTTGVARAMDRLSAVDRRYVELEAAKILRANADCHDLEELSERTLHIAAVDTSTMPTRRSRDVTEALSGRVVQLAQRRRRPTKTASRPPVIQDFPSELLYL